MQRTISMIAKKWKPSEVALKQRKMSNLNKVFSVVPTSCSGLIKRYFTRHPAMTWRFTGTFVSRALSSHWGPLEL